MPSSASCLWWGACSRHFPTVRSGGRLPGRRPHPEPGATRAAAAELGMALPMGGPRRGLRLPRR
eukprot:10526914-Alexandrium_andersonii.AAC.1